MRVHECVYVSVCVFIFPCYFIYFERDRERGIERERARTWPGEGQRGTENPKQAPCCQHWAPLGAQTHKLTNWEIMTWAEIKSQFLTNWATQEPQHVCVYVYMHACVYVWMCLCHICVCMRVHNFQVKPMRTCYNFNREMSLYLVLFYNF